MKALIQTAFSLIVVVTMLAACSDDSLVSEPTDPESVAGEMLRADSRPHAPSSTNLGKLGGRSDVAICHFPPGNDEAPQVITVGKSAAEVHVREHEGDGVVGVDYDQYCQPLAGCPCWEEADIGAIVWELVVDDWTDGSGSFYWLYAFKNYVGSHTAKVQVGDGEYLCGGLSTGTGPIDLRPKVGVISLPEAQSCVDLLRKYAP